MARSPMQLAGPSPSRLARRRPRSRDDGLFACAQSIVTGSLGESGRGAARGARGRRAGELGAAGTPCEFRPEMPSPYVYTHEMLFDLKRVYWSAHANLLRGLRRRGLTPARLEVLRLIEMGYSTQAALRRALGVARSTISRMLTAMEARGQVVRTSSAPQRARKHLSVPRRVRALASALGKRIHSVVDRRVREIVRREATPASSFVARASDLLVSFWRARGALRDRSVHPDPELLRPSPPRPRMRRSRIKWCLKKKLERFEVAERRREAREAEAARRRAKRGAWASGEALVGFASREEVLAVLGEGSARAHPEPLTPDALHPL